MEYFLFAWVVLLTYLFVRSQLELEKNLNLEANLQEERLGALQLSLEAKTQQLEEMNEHFEHLNRSIIYHLHASGTVYQSRIWDTYNVELNDSFELQGKEPSSEYFPLCVSTPPKELKLDVEDYSYWREQTDSTDYADNPNVRIDSDYVHELTDRWI
jgi:hypothetical protein